METNLPTPVCQGLHMSALIYWSVSVMMLCWDEMRCLLFTIVCHFVIDYVYMIYIYIHVYITHELWMYYFNIEDMSKMFWLLGSGTIRIIVATAKADQWWFVHAESTAKLAKVSDSVTMIMCLDGTTGWWHCGEEPWNITHHEFHGRILVPLRGALWCIWLIPSGRLGRFDNSSFKTSCK